MIIMIIDVSDICDTFPGKVTSSLQTWLALICKSNIKSNVIRIIDSQAASMGTHLNCAAPLTTFNPWDTNRIHFKTQEEPFYGLYAP